MLASLEIGPAPGAGRFEKLGYAVVLNLHYLCGKTGSTFDGLARHGAPTHDAA